jgi:glycosyltransferase involved in cell wall biosynthesis
MRIILISIWKPRKGGIVTHVENLMKNSKNEFTILTCDWDAIPILRSLSFLLIGLVKGLRMEGDLFHAHYALPQGLLGVLLKKIKQKPLVLTVHGSDITVLTKNMFTKRLVKYVLNACDRIIAVSEFLKKEIMKLGIDGEKISVIRGGAGLKKGKGEFHLEGKIVTFVGALVKQKGVDILIKAFEEVKSEVKEAKLVIVGEGKEMKKLETMAERIGDVHFLGYKDELNSILEKSMVLVLPSREEGLGLILLEAMSMGVPVIATKTGGIPEIINEGGILVEKENPGELAKAMVMLLSDEKLREKLAKKGKEEAGRFTWEKAGREIDELYEIA